MDNETRLLQAEVIRTREQMNAIAEDVDDLNNDFVVLNKDVENAVELSGDAVTTAQTADANASAALSANDATNVRVSNLERKEDERAHYLGAFETTAKLQAYPTPTENDFADNYETMTRWIYTNNVWTDTNEKIAISYTGLSNTAPLMDSTSDAGASTFASRADHVHPSDVSRVPITRTVNGKTLNEDITFNAEEVGAVPTSRTINGKELSSNIILTADDVGAYSPLNLSPVYRYHKRISVVNPFYFLGNPDKEYKSDIPETEKWFKFEAISRGGHDYNTGAFRVDNVICPRVFGICRLIDRNIMVEKFGLSTSAKLVSESINTTGGYASIAPISGTADIFLSAAEDIPYKEEIS